MCAVYQTTELDRDLLHKVTHTPATALGGYARTRQTGEQLGGTDSTKIVSGLRNPTTSKAEEK